VYVLDQQFHSLQDLVNFYSEHDVPNVEAITGVRLTCPVGDYSADEIDHLQNDLLRHRRSRVVSADHAQTRLNVHELSHTDCPDDVSRMHRHSVSESQHDKVLLSKTKNWSRKILETLKHSNKTSKSDTQNTTIQLVTSHESHEVACDHQLVGDFSENLKKFEKQPAIPSEGTHPALANVHEDLIEAHDVVDTATTNSLYYSEPRDVDRNLSVDLMAHLWQQDSQGHSTDGKCICGLDLAESELPRGWSMHISTECGTEGRVFFTSPTGETSWELPTIVSVDLSTEQQDRIRQLMTEGQHAVHDVSNQQVSVSRQFSNSDKRISV